MCTGCVRYEENMKLNVNTVYKQWNERLCGGILAEYLEAVSVENLMQWTGEN